MARRDIRYVSGHFAFSELVHGRFGDRWESVTIMRDPVTRWFSHYFFNRYKPDEHFRIHDDLGSFLETGLGKRLGRFYEDKFASAFSGDLDDIDRAIDAAKGQPLQIRSGWLPRATQ